MSRIKLKITQHTKNQENENLNDKRQMTHIIIEMNQMLQLSEENFKVAVVKILSDPLQILCKQIKKEKSHIKYKSC